MFGFIKVAFIIILASIVNVSNHTKCVSLSNQPCLARSPIHTDEYYVGLHYFLFMVNSDGRNGNCNSLNSPFDRICVPIKTEDVNVCVFNMITRKNESKTIAKHFLCEWKFKFDGRKCKSNQKWNNDKCQCQCKYQKKRRCKKRLVPAACACENGKY